MCVRMCLYVCSTREKKETLIRAWEAALSASAIAPHSRQPPRRRLHEGWWTPPWVPYRSSPTLLSLTHPPTHSLIDNATLPAAEQDRQAIPVCVKHAKNRATATITSNDQRILLIGSTCGEHRIQKETTAAADGRTASGQIGRHGAGREQVGTGTSSICLPSQGLKTSSTRRLIEE